MKQNKEEIDIYQFGIYRMGLTDSEIKEYLSLRQGKKKIKDVWKKFCFTAGVNTMAMITCEFCKKNFCLMYRHDVLRFANVVFGVTKGTYFD